MALVFVLVEMNLKKSELPVNWITPYCCYFESDEGGILFGCPSHLPDETKSDLAGILSCVRVVFLTDTLHVAGVLNWDIIGLLRQLPCGHRIKIVGNQRQIEALVGLLQLSVTGPSAGSFKRWSKHYSIPGSRFKLLQRLNAYVGSPAFDFNTLLVTETYDAQRSFKYGHYIVSHLKSNYFEIHDNGVDAVNANLSLDFDAGLSLKFSREMSECLFSRGELSVKSMNTTSTAGDCLLIESGGERYLWGAPTYCSQQLMGLGISISGLSGVFIPSMAECHSSVLELLLIEPLALYTTVEIYESLLLKLSYLLDRPLGEYGNRQSIEGLIDFREITCGVLIGLGTGSFMPHYVVAPIPEFGGTFVFEEDHCECRLFLAGVNHEPEHIQWIESRGGLSPQWMADAKERLVGCYDFSLFNDRYALVDGGGVVAEHFGKTYRAHAGELKCVSLLGSGIVEELYEGGGSVAVNDRLIVKRAFRSFGLIDDEVIGEVCERGEVIDLKASAQVIKRDTSAEVVYVVISGNIGIYVEDHCLASLSPGTIFGEMAVLSGELRCADVFALSAIRLLRLDSDVFMEVVGRFGLVERFQRLWDVRDYLTGANVFKGLPYAAIQELTQELEARVSYSSGETLLTEGELGHQAYIICEGVVRIFKGVNCVAKLGEGEVFGELAALSEEPAPRSATVVADTSVVLLPIRGEALRELNQKYFSVNNVLYHLLRKRSLLNFNS